MDKEKLATRISVSLGTAFLLMSAFFFYLTIESSKKQEIRECKVLETYETTTGKYNHREFIIIVNVLDYNKTTYLEVSPSTFYRASQFMKTKQTVRYNFTSRQIADLSGGEDIVNKYFSLFWTFLLLGAAIYLGVLSSKIHFN